MHSLYIKKLNNANIFSTIRGGHTYPKLRDSKLKNFNFKTFYCRFIHYYFFNFFNKKNALAKLNSVRAFLFLLLSCLLLQRCNHKISQFLLFIEKEHNCYCRFFIKTCYICYTVTLVKTLERIKLYFL